MTESNSTKWVDQTDGQKIWTLRKAIEHLILVMPHQVLKYDEFQKINELLK